MKVTPVMAKATLKERTKHFIRRAKNKFGKVFLYDKTEYINNTLLVKIFCTVHKDYFTTLPSNFLSSNFTTCPRCKFNSDRSTWDQRKTLDNISYLGATGYPSFTEYFNGNSWIPISEYQEGTSVAVFDVSNSCIKLEIPTKFIKTKDISMVTFSTLNKTSHKPFSYITGINNKILLLRHGSYFTSYLLTKVTKTQKVYTPTVFKTQEIPLDMEDDLFRLYVHFYLTDSSLFKLRFGKSNLKITKTHDYEVARLEYLLQNYNFEYQIRKVRPSANHNYKYVFNIKLKNFNSLDIPSNWFNLSTYYKNIIVDEIFKYSYLRKKSVKKDAIKGNYFRCSNKKIFDFLQYTLHSLGMVPNFYIYKEGSGISYYYITTTSHGHRTLSNTYIEDYPYTGIAYGFNTKTGYCLFRQNNNIFIAPDGAYEIK